MREKSELQQWLVVCKSICKIRDNVFHQRVVSHSPLRFCPVWLPSGWPYPCH